MVRGPEDDKCCHNVVPMVDAAGQHYPLPYDFDSSGIVSPPYGAPSLGLKRFTQRKYRGFCHQNEELKQARKRFLELQPSMNELITHFSDIPGLKRKKMQKFVDAFYATLTNEKQFTNKLLGKCRGT